MSDLKFRSEAGRIKVEGEMREFYTIELIDGEVAYIEVAQVKETVEHAFNAWERAHRVNESSERVFNPQKIKLGHVWVWRIRVAVSELLPGDEAFFEKRQALNAAIKRLDRDEGLMPGARLVKHP